MFINKLSNKLYIPRFTKIIYPTIHVTTSIDNTRILDLKINGINNTTPNKANRAVEKVNIREVTFITIINIHIILENEERE